MNAGAAVFFITADLLAWGLPADPHNTMTYDKYG